MSKVAHPLFDHLIRVFQLRNDRELAELLDMEPPIISKIRHGRLPVSAATILKIYDACAMPIDAIRESLGNQS